MRFRIKLLLFLDLEGLDGGGRCRRDEGLNGGGSVGAAKALMVEGL